jgi:cyclopropane-fatty-acyl-phospholipid synthase
MFALEHSKAAYWTDFAIYGLFIGGMGIVLPLLAPRSEWLAMEGLAAAGLAAWSLVEYLMHRFVLHGPEPFRSWHARHHERPMALISSPTLLSATCISVLVFAPAALVADRWAAASLTVGIVAGYLAYALCHHGTHHWRARSGWFKERKRWHAIHHRRGGGECYGVTTRFWDRVFGTAPKDQRHGSTRPMR